MAKSYITSGIVKRNNSKSNIVIITLTIPIQRSESRLVRELDISHLAYLHCDKSQPKIKERIPFLKRLSNSTHKLVKNGNNSPRSFFGIYARALSYIQFCDYQGVDPFSEQGYLAYFGNMGELRHQINQYQPSKRIFEYKDGQEIGIKEITASTIQGGVANFLNLCGINAKPWFNQCRAFNQNGSSFMAYSDRDENMIVSHLSTLFFGLAAQLIALKEMEEVVPYIDVSIDIFGRKEILSFSTALENPLAKNIKDGYVFYGSAFNLAMCSAYHLLCFYTSFNDEVTKNINHPLKVVSEKKDRTLKTVTLKGFKRRAYKEQEAVLSDDLSDEFTVDIDKRTGVDFVQLLSQLSRCYGSDKYLFYTLNSNGQISADFRTERMNVILTSSLNLISDSRSANLDWLKEHFNALLQNKSLTINTEKNEQGRTIVKRSMKDTSKKTASKKLVKIAYLILSCLTDKSLKGIVLPLTYSDKDTEGNVVVSFKRHNKNLVNNKDITDIESESITVSAIHIDLIKRIETWATSRPCTSTQSHYLLRFGVDGQTRQWEGATPIVESFLRDIGIMSNEYFVNLSSSRFRETTSYQTIEHGHAYITMVALGNSLKTAESSYGNGHPETNRVITSQALQCLEHIVSGNSVDDAKEKVRDKLKIPMLAHDEYVKKKIKTMPNGIACDGKQQLISGKKTQVAANKKTGKNRPCASFDQCYKCKSAKAINEVESIYKLVSFVDVLKEALDRYPGAKSDVTERIDEFESIVDDASPNVINEALERFNRHGRHPRVTMSHAVLTINTGSNR